MKLAALWLGVGSIDSGRIVGYTEATARVMSVSRAIVYSVRIGPRNKNFSFQRLPRTPQPSELTIS